MEKKILENKEISQDAIQENIDTILKLEKETLQNLSTIDFISDKNNWAQIIK